jgi:hypothetical protein
VAIIYRIGVIFKTRAKSTPYKATKKRGVLSQRVPRLLKATEKVYRGTFSDRFACI